MKVNGAGEIPFRKQPIRGQSGQGPAVETSTPAIQQATLALMALAVATVELAIAELGAAPVLPLTLAACWTAGVLVVSRYVGRRVSRRAQAGYPAGRKPPPLAAVVLLVLFGLPLVIELVRLVLLGPRYPLEILLLACFRNLGLGLAALSVWPLCLRLAALVSLFMVLVASSLAGGPLVLWFLGAYVAAGCLWLMVAYWTALRWHIPAGRGGRFPLAASLLVIAIAGSVVGAARLAPTHRLMATLAELVPSSGGTQGYHPNARGGVNDGDDEVSGENALSVGFVDSETFLDSDKPSLYDVFNETYGEPVKRKEREHQRAIALDATQMRQWQKEAAENLRPGREFALQRQSPKPPAAPGDRPPEALLYVKGSTPLHLRLTAYDRFDGVSWLEAPFTQRGNGLRRDAEPRWLSLGLMPAPVYAGTRSYQIKVGLLETPVLPFPSHVRRFRLGRVDRPDFFSWAQEEILRIPCKIPSSVMIDVEAHTLSPQGLQEVNFPSPPPVSARYLTPCEGKRIDPAVAELARQWAGQTRRGWTQVEAVLAGLRAWCVHDREARSPPTVEDGVAHFLLTSRRGPDYAFASAAVVLLRSLDYPARLVSGFYASPERYDRRTRHTPVLAEDAHFWAEVLLPCSVWVTLEPTPGYEVLPPALPWSEQLWLLLLTVGSWVRQQAVVLALGLAALAALIRFRRHVFDPLATVWWWLAPGRSGRSCVLRTLKLMENRARWAGRPRPAGQPLARWYGAAAKTSPPEFGTELERLVILADWAAYAPATSRPRLPAGDAEARVVCRRVVRQWTVRRFQASGRSTRERQVLP